MNRSRSILAAWACGLAASLLAGCTTPPSADGLDHPAVARYVAGWQAHDGAQVSGAFAPDGRYRDPSLPEAIDRAGVAAHVATHRDARFELRNARRVDAEHVELRWQAVWPQRQQAFDYVDTVTLQGDGIGRVESTGLAPPEAAGVVAAYEVLHDTPTPERQAALLTTDVEVYGSTLPASGLRYDTFTGFLATLRGTTFRQQPDRPLAMTKDGRIVLWWTLAAGPKPLAAGVDYLTVEQGRIRKIVGVYGPVVQPGAERADTAARGH